MAATTPSVASSTSPSIDFTTGTTPPSTEAVADATTDDSPGVGQVGQSGFKYTDGLTVAVLSVKKTKVSAYAFGHKSGNIPVAITVQFRNGSSEVVDLTSTSINVTAGEDGTQAEDVFDDDTAGFDGKVAPGRKATGVFKVDIPKAAIKSELTIEVEPGFLDYESSLFTGKVS